MALRMFLRVVVALGVVSLLSRATEPTAVTLVAPGSTWRFWDYSDPPSSFWTTLSFADGGWGLGPGQFGYGEADEATWIAPGGAPHTTTHYFRHKFHVARAADFTNLLAQVLRDDGVVVYLNSHEVFRMNMPDGPTHHLTYALSQVSGTNENYYFPTNFSSAPLVDGDNILAVELHQTPNPVDASFDMALIGIGPPRETEPPRLAAAVETRRITLEWQGNDVLLEQRVLPSGSWQALTNAVSPYEIPLPAEAGDSRLFRLRRK